MLLIITIIAIVISSVNIFLIITSYLDPQAFQAQVAAAILRLTGLTPRICSFGLAVITAY